MKWIMEHILEHMVTNVIAWVHSQDGNAMAAAAEISERWRHFVERAIWAKPAIIKQLNYQGRRKLARDII